MLEAPMTDEGQFVLVHNPTSTSGRPRHSPKGSWTNSEWTSRVKPDAQAAAVAAGEADLAFDIDDSGRLDDLFVGFPAQVHTSQKLATRSHRAQHEGAPFDDPEVHERSTPRSTDTKSCRSSAAKEPGYQRQLRESPSACRTARTADPGPAAKASWSAGSRHRPGPQGRPAVGHGWDASHVGVSPCFLGTSRCRV